MSLIQPDIIELIFSSVEMKNRLSTLIPEEDIMSLSTEIQFLHIRNWQNSNNLFLYMLLLNYIWGFQLKENSEELNKFKEPININENGFRIHSHNQIIMVSKTDMLLIHLRGISTETADCIILNPKYNKLGVSISAMLAYYLHFITKIN
jgi:hypothetical protein